MKRPTRDLITAAALLLFNEKGIDPVNTRDIAAKAGISLGNLTYHFPTKNDIVHALCRQLIEEVSRELQELPVADRGIIEVYYTQVETIFRTQLKYRFILNKRYAEILTSLPEMQKNYQDVLIDRFNQFAGLHAELVKQKLAKATLVENTDGVFYILNMLAIYWQQEAEIYFPHLSDDEKLAQALAVYFQTYLPYLTSKGDAILKPLVKPILYYRELKNA